MESTIITCRENLGVGCVSPREVKLASRCCGKRNNEKTKGIKTEGIQEEENKKYNRQFFGLLYVECGGKYQISFCVI